MKKLCVKSNYVSIFQGANYSQLLKLPSKKGERFACTYKINEKMRKFWSFVFEAVWTWYLLFPISNNSSMEKNSLEQAKNS